METDTTLHTLYVASDSGEDDPVVQFLDNVGLSYRIIHVTADNRTRAGGPAPKFASANRLPVLEWDGEHRLSNFGVRELIDFLHDRGVELEDS